MNLSTPEERSWESVTLADLLGRGAATWPDQEALVIGNRRLTYSALAQEVALAAQALCNCGVSKGDHVAICMGNSIEWVTTFYAAAALGAVTVPVNTRFKTDELHYVLRQANVSTLVVVDRFLDKIDFVAMLREIEPAIDTQLPGSELPGLHSVIVVGEDIPSACRSVSTLSSGIPRVQMSIQLTSEDVLLIQYTSGTTSFPKGVLLTHQNMLRNAAAVAKRVGVQPGDRYFSARPFFHVAGTTLSLLVALVSGACLVSLPTFDAGDALRAMDTERCSLVSGNDTMFLMMMNHPDFDPSRLHLRGGWAAAGPEVFRQAVERMGIDELCFAYGLSEASPNVVMSDRRDDRETRIAGLARPHAGVEVRCVEPSTGVDQPFDTPGEILVRGWSLMQGYYDKPDETATAIDAAGWLHTGDLGALTSEGRLRFVGRLKDMVRVGGENVAPAEVEEVLHSHPAVRKAEVIGVPDKRLGEVVAAYVQLREGACAEPQELIDFCRKRCANFKVPSFLRIVENFDEIGMTSSSKVQKNRLREHALGDLRLEA